MTRLSDNWITENLIDFEYKKYVLLAYLKSVKDNFKYKKLYPDLSDLISHYKNLIQIKNNSQIIEQSANKRIKSVDLKNLKFEYENAIEPNELINEIKNIIEYSEPLIINELHTGKEIFDFAEKHIEFSHVGILPLYKKEGYFMINPYQSSEVLIYNYELTKINTVNDHFYGLKSSYFETIKTNISTTIDNIKFSIIEKKPELPNPAVYLFKATANIPNDETLLPIAKRILYNTLQEAA